MAHNTKVKNITKNTTLYAVYQEKNPIVYLHYGDLRRADYDGKWGDRSGGMQATISQAYQEWSSKWEDQLTYNQSQADYYAPDGSARSWYISVDTIWLDYRQVQSFEFDALNWTFDPNKTYYEFLYFLDSASFSAAGGTTYKQTNGYVLGQYDYTYAKPQMLVTKDETPSTSKNYYVLDKPDYVVRTKLPDGGKLSITNCYKDYSHLQSLADKRKIYLENVISYYDNLISETDSIAEKHNLEIIRSMFLDEQYPDYAPISLNSALPYLNIYLDTISDIDDRYYDLSTNKLYISGNEVDLSSIKIPGCTQAYSNGSAVDPNEPGHDDCLDYYSQWGEAYGEYPCVPFGWNNTYQYSNIDERMLCANEWYTSPNFHESTKWDFNTPFVFKDEVVCEQLMRKAWTLYSSSGGTNSDYEMYTFAAKSVIQTFEKADVSEGFEDGHYYVRFDSSGNPFMPVVDGLETEPLASADYWIVSFPDMLVKGTGTYNFCVMNFYDSKKVTEDTEPVEGKIYCIQNESETYTRNYNVTSTNFSEKTRYILNTDNESYSAASDYSSTQAYYDKNIELSYTKVVYGNDFTVQGVNSQLKVRGRRTCPAHFTVTLDTEEVEGKAYYEKSGDSYTLADFDADKTQYEYKVEDPFSEWMPTSDVSPLPDKVYMVRTLSDGYIVFLMEDPYAEGEFDSNKTYYESVYYVIYDPTLSYGSEMTPEGGKPYYVDDPATNALDEIYFRKPSEFKDGLGSRYHLYARYNPIAFVDKALASVPDEDDLETWSFDYSDYSGDALTKVQAIYNRFGGNERGAKINSSQFIQLYKEGLIAAGTGEIYSDTSSIYAQLTNAINDLTSNTNALYWERDAQPNTELVQLTSSNIESSQKVYYYESIEDGNDKVRKSCSKDAYQSFVDGENIWSLEPIDNKFYTYQSKTYTINKSIGSLTTYLKNYGYVYSNIFYNMLIQKYYPNISSVCNDSFSTVLKTGYYYPEASSYPDALYETNAYVYACETDNSEQYVDPGWAQGFEFNLEALGNISLPGVGGSKTYNLSDLTLNISTATYNSDTGKYYRIESPQYSMRFGITASAKTYCLKGQANPNAIMTYANTPSNRRSFAGFRYDYINGCYSNAGSYMSMTSSTTAETLTTTSDITYTDDVLHRAFYCLYRTVQNDGNCTLGTGDLLLNATPNAYGYGTTSSLSNDSTLSVIYTMAEPRVCTGKSKYGGDLYKYTGTGTYTIQEATSVLVKEYERVNLFTWEETGNTRSIELDACTGTTDKFIKKSTLNAGDSIPLLLDSRNTKYEYTGPGAATPSYQEHYAYSNPNNIGWSISNRGAVTKYVGMASFSDIMNDTANDVSEYTYYKVEHYDSSNSNGAGSGTKTSYNNPFVLAEDDEGNYIMSEYLNQSIYPENATQAQYTASQDVINFTQMTKRFATSSAQHIGHWCYIPAFSYVIESSYRTASYYISDGIMHLTNKRNFTSDLSYYKRSLYGTNKALVMDLHMITPFNITRSLSGNFGIHNWAVTFRWEDIETDE